ncbi:MAG: 50S ribosomal protein L9 [Patescibacteria group bacterium]
MKVLFTHNIKGVAQIGDIKEVSDGYARNYLLPHKLAKPATRDVAKEAEGLKKQREEVDIRSMAQAKELAEKLKDTVIEFKESANQEGHLYGSIDAKKIAHAINIPSDQVLLDQPIKTVGEHKVELKLHQTTATTLTVRVLPS